MQRCTGVACTVQLHVHHEVADYIERQIELNDDWHVHLAELTGRGVDRQLS